MAIIKDPVFGTAARVGKDGRLRAAVVQQTKESQAATDGDAFIVGTVLGVARTLTLVTGNVYALLHIQNNSPDKILVLDSASLSSDLAGVNLFVTKNPIVGALTNEVLIVPVNRNFASSEIPDVAVLTWDEVGTAGIVGITGGVEFQSLILPPSVFNISLGGTFRLGRGNSVMMSIANDTGSPAEVTAAFRFHMQEAGDGLA